MPETVSSDPTGHEPVPDAFRAAIAEILQAFVSRQRAMLAPLGPDLDPLFDAAQVAVEGGKRLRAAFAYWGWRTAGGSASNPGSLLRAAAASELVHASALVHDERDRRISDPAGQAFRAPHLHGPTTARHSAGRGSRHR